MSLIEEKQSPTFFSLTVFFLFLSLFFFLAIFCPSPCLSLSRWLALSLSLSFAPPPLPLPLPFLSHFLSCPLSLAPPSLSLSHTKQKETRKKPTKRLLRVDELYMRSYVTLCAGAVCIKWIIYGIIPSCVCITWFLYLCSRRWFVIIVPRQCRTLCHRPLIFTYTYILTCTHECTYMTKSRRGERRGKLGLFYKF